MLYNRHSGAVSLRTPLPCKRSRASFKTSRTAMPCVCRVRTMWSAMPSIRTHPAHARRASTGTCHEHMLFSTLQEGIRYKKSIIPSGRRDNDNIAQISEYFRISNISSRSRIYLTNATFLTNFIKCLAINFCFTIINLEHVG